jgi:hypothetical protein
MAHGQSGTPSYSAIYLAETIDPKEIPHDWLIGYTKPTGTLPSGRQMAATHTRLVDLQGCEEYDIMRRENRIALSFVSAKRTLTRSMLLSKADNQVVQTLSSGYNDEHSVLILCCCSDS